MDIFKNVIEMEEKIMAAWNTAEDIQLLFEQYLDGPGEMSEDEVSNALLGIQTLHNMRMQQLWAEFEKLAEARRNHL